MGKGIDLTRDYAPEHAKALDDMKDQLLIVCMKRLAVDGKVSIPVSEIDDTGRDLLSFRVDFGTRTFHFELSKKS